MLPRDERGEIDGEGTLLKGLDNNKDQSYFLHAVGHKELEKTLFPVGEIAKPEVRALAEQHDLSTAKKKDSTGICFIGERRFKDFLQQYLPAQPGDIHSVDGEYLGRHQGLMYHTIGQRQGLGIGGRHDGSGAPWYVAGKELDSNTLIVVQGHEHPALFHQSLRASQLRWIAGQAPSAPLRCQAKIRYRQHDQACVLETLDARGATIRFSEPQRAITPGQSIVFYLADDCLGGGVIDTAWD